MVDGFVDAMVTPAGLARFMEAKKDNNPLGERLLAHLEAGRGGAEA
jgi:hypothetical protein